MVRDGDSTVVATHGWGRKLKELLNPLNIEKMFARKPFDQFGVVLQNEKENLQLVVSLSFNGLGKKQYMYSSRMKSLCQPDTVETSYIVTN